MNKLIFGNLSDFGIEVIERDEKLYVRYDAGSHMEKWREDEITKEELAGIEADGLKGNRTMFEIQKRLEQDRIDPYSSNWSPSQSE